MITRRQFLKTSAATGAPVSAGIFVRPRRAFPFAQSPTNIRKFITNLPGLGPTGANQMHPDLPRSTHFWGYYDLTTGDQKYLVGVIVAKRGTPPSPLRRGGKPWGGRKDSTRLLLRHFQEEGGSRHRGYFLPLVIRPSH